jgi:hypothetical protein
VDGLSDILPVAAADTHAIGEMQPVGLGPQIDRGDALDFALPLPDEQFTILSGQRGACFDGDSSR